MVKYDKLRPLWKHLHNDKIQGKLVRFGKKNHFA
jgi:hypothetical protein